MKKLKYQLFIKNFISWKDTNCLLMFKNKAYYLFLSFFSRLIKKEKSETFYPIDPVSINFAWLCMFLLHVFLFCLFHIYIFVTQPIYRIFGDKKIESKIEATSESFCGIIVPDLPSEMISIANWACCFTIRLLFKLRSAIPFPLTKMANNLPPI